MPDDARAEIIALINSALDAFNRKDFATFEQTFRGTVVIIDGFAPFRWGAPDAASRWWADAETWAKAGGVLGEHISLQEIRYVEVNDSRAYAVLSATLTITLKAAEPVERPGILVYTFARHDDGWKS